MSAIPTIALIRKTVILPPLMKKILAAFAVSALLTDPALLAQDEALPFGPDFKMLETASTGEWWNAPTNKVSDAPDAKGRKPKKLINLNVPRDQVVAFAIYTHDRGVLKLTRPTLPSQARRSARSSPRIQTRRQVAGSRHRGSSLPRVERPLPHRGLGQHQGHSLPRPPRRQSRVRRPHPQGPHRQGRHRRGQPLLRLQPHQGSPPHDP